MNLQEPRSHGDAAFPVEHRTPGLGATQQTTGANPDRSANDATVESPSRHTAVHRMAVRIFWPLTAAICAALAVVATGELHYHAIARFHVNGSMDAGRRELLDFLWLHAGRDHLADWHVQTPSDNATLQANIAVTDPDRADALIRSLADEFKKHVADRTPVSHADDAERVLSDLIRQWRTRVATLRREMEQLQATTAADDEADARDADTRLSALIGEYESLRGAENDAAARIDRLRTTPTEPRVDPETRQARYASRLDLQEDLDELTVQLTLGRRQLDTVWQSASPALDDLISAGARLVRQGSSDASRTADAAHRAIVADLTHRAELYQKRLNVFSKKWTETFVRLRSQPTDPHAPRLFVAQKTLHDLLADFSFHAGKLVDDMRDQIQALATQTDDADHHTLVSQARRAFHRLEADHRQFELLAADVYRRNNFRLDAAIKSARGLRRRVRTTVDAIDAKLLADATTRASRVRQMEQREADRRLRTTRERCHETVDALLKTLSIRDRAHRQMEARERDTEKIEAMKHRIADAEQQLQARESLLDDHLRNVQAAKTPPLSVEIIECRADNTPRGLARKLSYAAGAAVLAFMTATFVTRR